MAENTADVNLEEAVRFSSRCTAYGMNLDACAQALKRALDRVGETWLDPDAATIAEMVQEIQRIVRDARTVANEELVPFVERKIALIEGK